jgi:hypothetical protein
MNWVLLGSTGGKRQLGRHRRGWQGSMKMGPKLTDWEGVGCIEVVQDTDNWRRAGLNTAVVP